ncbi:hypothetical protein Tco_1329708 [Tanacetum coccineum]
MKSRNRVNTYAARITKMIADIEDRHHGPIDIEKVAVSSSLRLLEPKHIIESRAKRSSIKSRYDTYPILLSFTHCGNKSILRVLRIILVILPEHPSETRIFHNEDGNPARANIKQALGRSMIGSLMYLTSSRLDIMFAVCACARYQVNPKVSHLYVVKRIFRLISWQCKKQTVVANSTTEAEYVAASSCCGQVLWI